MQLEPDPPRKLLRLTLSVFAALVWAAVALVAAWSECRT